MYNHIIINANSEERTITLPADTKFEMFPLHIMKKMCVEIKIEATPNAYSYGGVKMQKTLIIPNGTKCWRNEMKKIWHPLTEQYLGTAQYDYYVNNELVLLVIHGKQVSRTNDGNTKFSFGYSYEPFVTITIPIVDGDPNIKHFLQGLHVPLKNFEEGFVFETYREIDRAEHDERDD